MPNEKKYIISTMMIIHIHTYYNIILINFCYQLTYLNTFTFTPLESIRVKLTNKNKQFLTIWDQITYNLVYNNKYPQLIVHLLQLSISYYNFNLSNVYTILPEFTKAFDRVNYCKQFRK